MVVNAILVILLFGVGVACVFAGYPMIGLAMAAIGVLQLVRTVAMALGTPSSEDPDAEAEEERHQLSTLLQNYVSAAKKPDSLPRCPKCEQEMLIDAAYHEREGHARFGASIACQACDTKLFVDMGSGFSDWVKQAYPCNTADRPDGGE